SPASQEPLLLLPRSHQEGQLRAVALHLGHGRALPEDGPRWAGLHTLATGRATVGTAPRLIQVGDDTGIGAPAAHIPGVGALDLVADAHTARAEDTAVMVDAKAVVSDIHMTLGRLVLVADMIHAEGHGHVLQFAVAVGHAHGADVVAL